MLLELYEIAHYITKYLNSYAQDKKEEFFLEEYIKNPNV